MAQTKTATLQTFSRLVRRSKVSHFTDDLSKTLMGVSQAILEFFDITSESGEVELPDAADVKSFIQQALPPSQKILDDPFFEIP